MTGQLTLTDFLAERREGIQVAEGNALDRWKLEANVHINILAATGDPFVADQVRASCGFVDTPEWHAHATACKTARTNPWSWLGGTMQGNKTIRRNGQVSTPESRARSRTVTQWVGLDPND